MNKIAFLLVLFAALAAGEASQSRDERSQTTAPVSDVDQPRPAAEEPEARLGNSATPPAEGNPLRAIPLSALSATRDRPLFSLSHRPPPPAVVPAPAPVAVSPATPTKPAEPERPPLTLLGTVVGQDKRLAIFFNQSTHQPVRLEEGRGESGWRLKSDSPRSAVVEKDGLTVTIDLPRSGDTSVATGEPTGASVATGNSADAPAAPGNLAAPAEP